MLETAFDKIDNYSRNLKLNLTKEELAHLAEHMNLTDSDLANIEQIFRYLNDKHQESIVNTCLKLSRLPSVNPKTFDGFDFTRLHGQDVDRIKALSTLAPLYEHRNIAFIGSQGLGKTHLAMAFGRACCELGLKTYFLTSSELNQKLTQARKMGRTATVISGLVKASCLIIDEIGRCNFDTENTRLFFDVVDRRTNKEGPNCMIFTSNKTPDTWGQYFEEEDSLLCALDRIFDDAIVYMMKGIGYRGRKLETVAVEAK